MRWVAIGGAVGAAVDLVVQWPGLRFWQNHILEAPGGRSLLYAALVIVAGMGMGGLVSPVPDKRWAAFAGLLGAVLGLAISWPMVRGRDGILITFDDPRHGAMLFAISLALAGMGVVVLVSRFVDLSGKGRSPSPR
jgi:hypothetical protein